MYNLGFTGDANNYQNSAINARELARDNLNDSWGKFSDYYGDDGGDGGGGFGCFIETR